MATLLITTLNNPENNIAAAIEFKKAVKGLLADRIEQVDTAGKSLWTTLPPELNELPRADRKKFAQEFAKEKYFAFHRWIQVWPNLSLKRHENIRKAIETFFPLLYSEPVHCWVVGGHHHGQRENVVSQSSRYRTMVWGDDGVAADSVYYPYVGFGVRHRDQEAKRQLEWFGYVGKANEPRTFFEMADARKNLRHVRLMIVLACNGVPGASSMGRSWQEFLRDQQRLPMIVGWKSVINAAKNGTTQCTTHFGAHLKKLAASSDEFLNLFESESGRQAVIQSWGAACWTAFMSAAATKPRRTLLWHECAVLAPDRSVWGRNPGYRGGQTAPPFDPTLPLPLIKIGEAP